MEVLYVSLYIIVRAILSPNYSIKFLTQSLFKQRDKLNNSNYFLSINTYFVFMIFIEITKVESFLNIP